MRKEEEGEEHCFCRHAGMETRLSVEMMRMPTLMMKRELYVRVREREGGGVGNGGGESVECPAHRRVH